MLVLTIFAATLFVLVSTEKSCPPCDLDACEVLSCTAGQKILGSCPCCPSCLLDEGESCYNSSIKALKRQKRGVIHVPCGENLDCLLRHDLGPLDKPEALCTCHQTEPVCGSNNKTYETICQMRHESIKGNQQGALVMKSWGPCKSAPTIESAPEDTSGHLHQGIALDCEAKGYPIPDIHWEFVGDNGEVRNLPSDDLFVAVQVRGGPESYMVTSWVQIVDLRHTDTGVFTCVATNSEGVARSNANVSVKTQKKQHRQKPEVK